MTNSQPVAHFLTAYDKQKNSVKYGLHKKKK